MYYFSCGKAASNHTHSYLPLSGGTVTGAVNVKGLASTASYIDLSYNGTLRTSLFSNVSASDATTTLWARTASLLLCSKDNNYETNVRGKGLSVSNANFTAGAYVAASDYRQWSSRLIKENIHTIDREHGLKVLDLNPVYFDYKEKFGGKKNQCGLIAEEVLEIIPEIVHVPDNYDGSEFDEDKGLNNKLLTVDYTKVVPYLIKICQIQQEQIDTLSKKVDKLEK